MGETNSLCLLFSGLVFEEPHPRPARSFDPLTFGLCLPFSTLSVIFVSGLPAHFSFTNVLNIYSKFLTETVSSIKLLLSREKNVALASTVRPTSQHVPIITKILHRT